MEQHKIAVAAISAKVRNFYDNKEPFRIYHGTTNSTRESQIRRNQMVDTSLLSNVLKIDTGARSVLVEPNVPMDALVEATLEYGLIPPVVMEFPGITVGGGFSGTSGESSSFKYGFFDRTVNWIEIVLANGDVVIASDSENSDLFHGAASSFGTLGVTTMLEIQLIDAKSHVDLTYQPIFSMKHAVEVIQQTVSDSGVDYVDGMLFSKTSGVICIGRLTNAVPEKVPIQGFTRPRDPWFYLHAKEQLVQSQETPFRIVIPLKDYLFRYDRGGFWVARYSFKYFLMPFNALTRWLLDRFMHTRVMYHALHQSGLSYKYTIQDVAIPYPKTDEFLDYLDTDFKHYPLWLCPLKQSGRSSDSSHGLLANTHSNLPDAMLNFGVWGPGPKNREEFVAWNREFERKVHSLGGQKWLYAHAYYTEDEFNKIYGGTEYDALREKYHATYLPSVYDKVKVDIHAEQEALKASWKLRLLALFWAIWPLRGLYGVYRAFRGGDYLLPRSERKNVGKSKSV